MARRKRKAIASALEAIGIKTPEDNMTWDARTSTHTPGGVMVRLPDGEPLPTVYHKRPALPCPECRRVMMPDNPAARAVYTRSIDRGVAYLECRSCKHTYSLPVLETR